MSLRLHAAGCAITVLGLLSCVVRAQTTTVAPSAAQRCLTRGELLLGTPAYPQ